MKKRGLSRGVKISFIVLFILVVALIVFLGFRNSWFGSNVSEGVTGNVIPIAIVDECELACSVVSVYDYCTKQRTITDEVVGSCDSLSKDYSSVSKCEGLC